MVKTTTIELISKKEFELIRITKDILKAVEESGVKNGVVYAITAHTTTAVGGRCGKTFGQKHRSHKRHHSPRRRIDLIKEKAAVDH